MARRSWISSPSFAKSSHHVDHVDHVDQNGNSRVAVRISQQSYVIYVVYVVKAFAGSLHWEDHLPIFLHAHDCPALGDGFVPSDVELLQFVCAVVRELARGIVVMHEEREARAGAGRRPLEHLEIAVGVAECGNRAPPDSRLDADGLPFLVVDQIDLRQFDADRPAVAHLDFELAAAADDLLGRNAVHTLGPRPHELDAAARHDIGLDDLLHNVEDIHMPSTLGDFEQLVLLALIRLGPGAYGATIRREIEERTGRELGISAVYTTLQRLEQKGFVRLRAGDPVPERGGRRRKHVELLAPGARALKAACDAFQSMTAGVERRLNQL